MHFPEIALDVRVKGLKIRLVFDKQETGWFQ